MTGNLLLPILWPLLSRSETERWRIVSCNAVSPSLLPLISSLPNVLLVGNSSWFNVSKPRKLSIMLCTQGRKTLCKHTWRKRLCKQVIYCACCREMEVSCNLVIQSKLLTCEYMLCKELLLHLHFIINHWLKVMAWSNPSYLCCLNTRIRFWLVSIKLGLWSCGVALVY